MASDVIASRSDGYSGRPAWWSASWISTTAARLTGSRLNSGQSQVADAPTNARAHGVLDPRTLTWLEDNMGKGSGQNSRARRGAGRRYHGREIAVNVAGLCTRRRNQQRQYQNKDDLYGSSPFASRKGSCRSHGQFVAVITRARTSPRLRSRPDPLRTTNWRGLPGQAGASATIDSPAGGWSRCMRGASRRH
jgi:hypothetical protein